MRRTHHFTAVSLGLAILLTWPISARQIEDGSAQTVRFRSGVELVNVTATVTDRNGRFVSGLAQSDFTVYEDEVRQEITHFTNERVPVSIGIVLDTSGSMAGNKLDHALRAIDDFVGSLVDPSDELFLYRFSSGVELVQNWTADRTRVRDAIMRVHAGGSTAMYDALTQAVAMAQSGRCHKKAVVLISDGNDTASKTDLASVKQMIRESDVLVYSIGIDGHAAASAWTGQWPFLQPARPRGSTMVFGEERVNAEALREITDQTGGRTEIIGDGADLEQATAGIADELSKQYYLGYPVPRKKDGRWHDIRVQLPDASLQIRARQGYIATP